MVHLWQILGCVLVGFYVITHCSLEPSMCVHHIGELTPPLPDEFRPLVVVVLRRCFFCFSCRTITYSEPMILSETKYPYS